MSHLKVAVWRWGVDWTDTECS